MNLTPHLAAIDRDLAELESERSTTEQKWARASGVRERRLLAHLHRLDKQIEQLNISRDRVIAQLRGERHLRLVRPQEGAAERRHAS